MLNGTGNLPLVFGQILVLTTLPGLPFNHWLRGSASPVLTATGFVSRRGKFLTHHRIHTAWPSTKKFDAGVTYNETFIYVLYLFHELTCRTDPSMDFHAWWLKRRGLVPFGGFRWLWHGHLCWIRPVGSLRGQFSWTSNNNRAVSRPAIAELLVQ